MAYSSPRKGGVIPKQIWKASREEGVDRKVTLHALKNEFVALLYKHGGSYEECILECAEKWGKKESETKRTIKSWRKFDKEFNGAVKVLVDEASHVLMETALETHKKRIAYGDRELMVQNGKPVLTPRGMALKARLEAEDRGEELGKRAEWEVLEELSNRHDESQDIYVVRVSYPENLVRQVLPNVEPKVFKADFNAKQQTSEELWAIVQQGVLALAPKQRDEAEVIEAEVLEEDGRE